MQEAWRGTVVEKVGTSGEKGVFLLQYMIMACRGNCSLNVSWEGEFGRAGRRRSRAVYRSCRNGLFFVLVLPLVACWITALADLVGAQALGLRLNFYEKSCPPAEALVRRTLRLLAIRDPTSFPALLRVAFHDCVVQGCDASILLDSDPTRNVTSELIAGKNFNIRRLDFIDQIKAALDNVCPGVVSCADIIVLAARDAIVTTGGPLIPVLTGRRDSLDASNTAADLDLPPTSISVDDILNLFNGSFGMTTEETVAILGAHTLGVAHCVSIVERLYPTVDPNLAFLFGRWLRFRCPSPTPTQNITAIQNDPTSFFFDNQYFSRILRGTGLLTVDSELSLDMRTGPYAYEYSQDRRLFNQVFTQAFLKLTQSNVLTGENGQIRANCHVVNPF